MRRVLLSTVLLLAGNAQAEDFTGFYAGINAGYARGHANDRTTSAAESLPSATQPGAELPPSARDAAQALHRSGSDGAHVPPGR